MQMQVKIKSQAKEEMDKSQREYYLREQMRAIKSELGDMEEATEEIDEFRENIKKAKMPEDVEKEAFKQLDRLDTMHADAAEAGIIRTYLEWLIDLPWSLSTTRYAKYCQGQEDSRRRPLRSGEGQGEDTRVSGRKET